jgi:tripeptide aminopeptidase
MARAEEKAKTTKTQPYPRNKTRYIVLFRGYNFLDIGRTEDYNNARPNVAFRKEQHDFMNAAINRDRLLGRFSALVSIDSPSFAERPMSIALSSALRELGLSVREDDSAEKTGGSCGNLFAFLDGTLPLPPLLFCAHMDTVEPSRGKQAVFHSDGTITSGGDTVLGADDVSALAAILEALTALKESGDPHRPVEILFTAAEEPYCEGSRAADLSCLRAKEAYVFDLAGPVGDAALAAPTILDFEMTFLGRAAHAGFAPEDGIHAVRAAAEAVAVIPCGRVNGATVNIGTISGGTADNIVPDRCAVTGEIRSLDDEEARAYLALVFDEARRAAEKYGAKIETKSGTRCTACRVPADGPTVRRFADACRTAGFAPRLRETFGGSDGSTLAQRGISSLVAATAMNACHTCREYTTADELTRAAKLALALMESRT